MSRKHRALTPFWLAIIGAAGTVLAPLIKRISVPDSSGQELREFVDATSHHFTAISQIIFVAGLILFVIFESLEKHVGPLVENEFKSAHDVLANGFSGVTRVFSIGFQKIEEVLSARVGAIPTVLKDAIEKALDKIAENNFKTPGVRDLVNSGKIDEAVAKIGRDEKQDSVRKKEEIAALLHSDDQKKWDAAAKVLDEVPESREARFYQALAYRYWGASQLNRAIEIAEKGLDYATKVEDMKIFTTLQNSLAYYYADGNRNDKEPEARKLARLALQAGGMHSVAALDTQGFVLICFGRTKEEVMEGVNFCQQALAKGARLSSSPNTYREQKLG